MMTVPILFNRQRVRKHRDRSAKLQDNIQDLIEVCADRLLERLEDIQRPFHDVLDIGGRGAVARFFKSKNIQPICADLSYKLLSKTSSSYPSVCFDEEFVPFKVNSFDLVIAHFNLHWVNDLPGVLLQIKNILRPDGLFLVAVPILPMLANLRQIMSEEELEVTGKISPRISPFPDLRACATLMQRAGFALPVVDKEVIDLVYRSPMALMRDLRFAGETNALVEGEKKFANRSFVAACLARLEQQGEIKMPLHFAVLTGWAPDPSQQQPLKPGQFTTSLEDIL